MNATVFFHAEKLNLSLEDGHDDKKLCLEISTDGFSSITIIAPRDVMIDALTDAFDRFIGIKATPEEAEKTAVTL